MEDCVYSKTQYHVYTLIRMEVASIPQGHYRHAMPDICGSNKNEDLKRKQVSWLYQVGIQSTDSWLAAVAAPYSHRFSLSPHLYESLPHMMSPSFTFYLIKDNSNAGRDQEIPVEGEKVDDQYHTHDIFF